MKKVIIIGNGFDLAHGFKTSFNDFANHIIENVIAKEIAKTLLPDDYKSPLLRKDLTIEEVLKRIGFKFESLDYYNKEDIVKLERQDGTIGKQLKSHFNAIPTCIENSFLGKLFNNSYTHWFDIEHAYFQELNWHLEEYKNEFTDYTDSIQLLEKLNNEFLYIKNELTKYLSTIERRKNLDIERFIKSHFRGGNSPIHIINFNYTNTIKFYIQYIGKPSLTTLHNIHGQLPDDNIIFGYGNDQHESYKEMKNLGVDEFLKNFKTYMYFRKSVYQSIIPALRHSKDVHVYVLGHSLGMSDKTLLQEVMNPKWCKSVTLFKRTDLKHDEELMTAEYDKLIYAASRIFEEDGEMRIVVSNYEMSPFFPTTITPPNDIT